ncbi:MAG: tripartite tricarboxylate transporter permease [Rhizobiaceae bacterium]|nr:tripartite tricarboxylate transporter permease [Rhizobiaceae bacterium]
MDVVLTALAELAEPYRMMMLFAGVFVGLVIGVVPGIGGIFGMALLVPLTYQMDPYSAFALLLGMGSVTTTSDTIPAVLFGVPGTVGAVATVVDGHAMARNGEAARAFGAAYMASMIGGVFGAALLALSIPVMRPLVLAMQTPDFFAVSAFGLSMVAMLAGSQPLKGFAAALLGLLASFIGIDANAGVHRWTFGQVYLWEGLPIVVVFLGLFGIPEMAAFLTRGSVQANASAPSYAGMFQGMRDTLREWPLVIRCSWIGTVLGAVPGVGVAALDWIAYGHAASLRNTGPKFGEGNVRGVIAPESANNAKEGGSLIPTVAFGVPGSASMSILLGAFLVQGLVPGPDMLGKHASLTVSMVLSIALANIIGAVACLLLTRPLARVAGVPSALLVPMILTFMLVGSYQTNMSALDFAMLAGIGFLGMATKQLNWPRAAFSLGFVLGPSLESQFFLAYQIHGWGWLGRPVVIVLLALAVAGFARQALVWKKAEGKPIALPAALPDGIFSLALLLTALAACATSFRFPFEASVFPLLTASILALIVAVIFVQTGVRLRSHAKGQPVSSSPAGEWLPEREAGLRGNMRITVLVVILAMLILSVGHLAASFLFVTAALAISGAKSLPRSAVYGLGTTIAIYAVFDLLVPQPWPEPWLMRLFSL